MAGKIVVDGKDVTELHPSRRGLVTITSHPTFDMEKSVLDNVMVYRSEDRTLLNEAMSIMGLGAYQHRKCQDLDAGLQQRVSMARALTRKPQVLILNDPVDRLGFEEGLYCLQVLKQSLGTLGTTILHFTSSRQAALELSDEILIVREAYIVETGTPEKLYYEPETVHGASAVGEVNFVSGVGLMENHIQCNYGMPIRMPESVIVRENAPCMLMFRPEAVQVSDRSERGCLNILVHCVENTFRGSGYYTTFQSEFEKFTVYLYRPLPRDKECVLNVPYSEIHMLQREN